jgi:ABC-type sugar transport system permease subunit
MGNSLIAFLVSCGISAWIYSKMMRQTGNNTKSAMTVAVLLAIIIFVVVIILLGLIPE